jgi:ribA/ribD-fused uncharacterized protein
MKYTFFYKSKLSQWHIVNFVIDGIKYNCCEQYMMASKARLFDDKEAYNKIMAATHPREQQSLGRIVKGYNQELWDKYKYNIVRNGNYHRFKQNKQDLEWLLATDGILVEASPVDGIWGVGLAANDPLIQDEKNWRGQNLLGKALTEVREMLREELQNESKLIGHKGPVEYRSDCVFSSQSGIKTIPGGKFVNGVKEN